MTVKNDTMTETKGDALQATEGKAKVYSADEVAKHHTSDDCWLIIGEQGQKKVYDVTKFLDDHPGGPEILLDVAGQDATDEFEDIGHSTDARRQLLDFEIGVLKEEATANGTSSTKSAQDKASGASHKNTGPNFLVVLLVPLLAVAAALVYRAMH